MARAVAAAGPDQTCEADDLARAHGQGRPPDATSVQMLHFQTATGLFAEAVPAGAHLAPTINRTSHPRGVDEASSATLRPSRSTVMIADLKICSR